MAEKEYIDRGELLTRMEARLKQLRNDYGNYDHYTDGFDEGCVAVEVAPAADVVEVVRCKDCKWFVPKHIQLPDGTTREYTQEEKELPLGVPGDVGINCGSRCMRHSHWEINRIPVWVQENDFCSYGERKEE